MALVADKGKAPVMALVIRKAEMGTAEMAAVTNG